jgi:hypothetical protein
MAVLLDLVSPPVMRSTDTWQCLCIHLSIAALFISLTTPPPPYLLYHYDAAWVHVNQGLYDGSDESHRRAIVEFEQYQTSQINCAVDLIKAAKGHPHLQSLCGLSPHYSPVKSDFSDQISRPTPMPSTRLSLANQGVDDLMILIVAFDLAHNHTVLVLDLEHNYIMAGGKMALAQALVSNVTLKTVHWTKQMDPLPPSAIYDEQRVRNAAINAKVDCVADQVRSIAFKFRISVAVFVRGTVLGPATLREVIEFLIGPGPQVGRFLRYRGPCHPSIY